MPWADEEPVPLEDVIERLRGFRARFDRGEDYFYGVFSTDESTQLGAGGLHPRIGYGGTEVGYWIRADRLREGLATELADALTWAALEHGDWERVEIHVDPRNAASLAIPRRLGYLEEATLRRRLPPAPPDAQPGDRTVFSIFASEYAPRGEYRAFDAAGRPL
jgi:RimJ/RimL family protein N-acetyltransferase